MDIFGKRFPKRTFDVGIAEQHAVTFAAGMAIEGLKPFCCIYSTFMQRGYDQVGKWGGGCLQWAFDRLLSSVDAWKEVEASHTDFTPIHPSNPHKHHPPPPAPNQVVHDVVIQKLPVRMILDRAGLVGRYLVSKDGWMFPIGARRPCVWPSTHPFIHPSTHVYTTSLQTPPGNDGPTHHGSFDLSYMGALPDIVIMAPSDEVRFVLLCWSAYPPPPHKAPSRHMLTINPPHPNPIPPHQHARWSSST